MTRSKRCLMPAPPREGEAETHHWLNPDASCWENKDFDNLDLNKLAAMKSMVESMIQMWRARDDALKKIIKRLDQQDN
ncbi:unnamed protein product [Linum trigynum]|uniref:Uncharacterized protein n=1 Tax=Linum trigynum TaxID=586398 RepID=A0AAV2FWJ2_9ROSI